MSAQRMPTDTALFDPTALKPGTALLHKSGGIIVLSHRKADNSGWWNEDGSGLADVAARSGYWTIFTGSWHECAERAVRAERRIAELETKLAHTEEALKNAIKVAAEAEKRAPRSLVGGDQ